MKDKDLLSVNFFNYTQNKPFYKMDISAIGDDQVKTVLDEIT